MENLNAHSKWDTKLNIRSLPSRSVITKEGNRECHQQQRRARMEYSKQKQRGDKTPGWKNTGNKHRGKYRGGQR